MTKFEFPEIEIIRFRVEDMITTSFGDNEFPLFPKRIEDDLGIASVD